jgi:hypothetical protein
MPRDYAGNQIRVNHFIPSDSTARFRLSFDDTHSGVSVHVVLRARQGSELGDGLPRLIAAAERQALRYSTH